MDLSDYSLALGEGEKEGITIMDLNALLTLNHIGEKPGGSQRWLKEHTCLCRPDHVFSLGVLPPAWESQFLFLKHLCFGAISGKSRVMGIKHMLFSQKIQNRVRFCISQGSLQEENLQNESVCLCLYREVGHY